MRRRFEVVEVTLAVGLDTFRPVTADDLADHTLHTEAYEVGEKAAAAIDRARAAGRRIVAVGTTSVRVLETVWGSRPPRPLAGRATSSSRPDTPSRPPERSSRTSTCLARRCSRW